MLTQKYRPKILQHVIGQRLVCETLQDFLIDPSSRNSTFLFHGKPGTGKTTVSSIVAKVLCPDDFGVVRFNAANDNGVAVIREISKDLHEGFIGDGYRVYIFEEAHKLTPEAQHCFLDDLECIDTEGVYFFLTTTEPEALLPTIRSRATSLEFGSVDDISILERLRIIKKIEAFDNAIITDAVLNEIVTTCNGSVRDAIKLLETAASMSSDENALSIVRCGGEEAPELVELCRIITNPARYKDYYVAIQIVDKSKQSADDMRRYICNYVHRIVVNAKGNKDTNLLMYGILNVFGQSIRYEGKYALTKMILETCIEL